MLVARHLPSWRFLGAALCATTVIALGSPTDALAEAPGPATAAPSTAAPSTAAPSTAVPSTAAPSTGAPSPAVPTGDAPTDAAPSPANPGPSSSGSTTGAAETVVGELVVAWPEHEDHREAEERAEHGPLTWIETPDGDAVRVPVDALTQDLADELPEEGETADALPAGATVEVVLGGEVADEATVEDGLMPARDVIAAEVVQAPPAEVTPTLPAGVTNQVTVVMVELAGTGRDGTGLADVVAAVDGPVRDFWLEQSDGAVDIDVTAQHDWITTDVGCGTPSLLWNDIAGRVGFVSGPGKHLLLYISNLPASQTRCHYGLAEVGSSPATGGRSYVRGTATSVIAHELGHNFGLGHSSGLQCDRAVDTGTCQTVSYRDFYDVMGISWDEVGSLNAPQAARIGLLSGAAVQAVAAPVSAPTTVTLNAQGTRTGTRAVRLTDRSGSVWWLEYRSASGRDSWLGTAANRYGLDAGVQLRRSSGSPDTSILLDGSPSPSGDWSVDTRASFPVDRTITVAGGDFAVRVESVSPTTAEVTIARGVTPGAITAITSAYDRSGGLDGPLGYPTTSEICGLQDGGCMRSYDHGAISYSPATGARVLHGPIHAAWAAAGAERGTVGYPVTDTICGGRDAGCHQIFQRAWMYDSAGTDATVVRGGLRVKWAATGAEWGVLGYPTAGERCGLPGGGCSQAFSGGSVVWSPVQGARAMRGPIAAHWAATGGVQSIGYPVSDTVCGGRDAGCHQVFERGMAFVSSGTPATFVFGGIREKWAATGAEWGVLGYPTAGERCGLPGGGCSQAFSGGSVVWSPVQGARLMRGPIAAHWASTGGARTIGYPVSDTVCGGRNAGCHQVFERGMAFVSSGTPATFVFGGIREKWAATGAEWGVLGYPTAGERCGIAGGGCSQAFSGGSIVWSPTQGGRVMRGPIAAHWAAPGGVQAVGYPVSDTVCGGRNAGCHQVFERGMGYVSSGTDAAFVVGRIRDKWAATGAEWGVLGYPTADQRCGLASEGCAQAFAGGSVYWSPGTGAHSVRGAIGEAWAAADAEQGSLGYPREDERTIPGGSSQRFTGGTLTRSASTGVVTRS